MDKERASRSAPMNMYESDMDQTRAKKLRILLRGDQISQNQHSRARTSGFEHGPIVGEHASNAGIASQRTLQQQSKEQRGGSKRKRQTTFVGSNPSDSSAPMESRGEASGSREQRCEARGSREQRGEASGSREDQETVDIETTNNQQPNQGIWLIANDGSRRFIPGILRTDEFYKLPNNERIEIFLDKHGRSYTYSHHVLMSFLGRLARNCGFCPLHITAWNSKDFIPFKAKIIECVQMKFIYPQGFAHTILKKVGELWKKHKGGLKRRHFRLEVNSLEDTIKGKPDYIDNTQWTLLVSRWFDAEYQAICKKNAENGKNTMPHTMGRKTYGILSKEMEEKDGIEPDRIDLFDTARRKKDGSCVRQELEQKLEEARSLKSNGVSGSSTSSDDIFNKVWGAEHSGRVRGMGFGVTPTSYFGPSQCGGRSNASQGFAMPHGPSMQQFNELAGMVKEIYSLLSEDIARKRGQFTAADAGSGARNACFHSSQSSDEVGTDDDELGDE